MSKYMLRSAPSWGTGRLRVPAAPADITQRMVKVLSQIGEGILREYEPALRVVVLPTWEELRRPGFRRARGLRRSEEGGGDGSGKESRRVLMPSIVFGCGGSGSPIRLGPALHHQRPSRIGGAA